MLPARVVKSSAPTITGEPLRRPEPATIPSAAISPPTSVPNSRNEPLSRRCSRRWRRACPCRGAWRAAPRRPSHERVDVGGSARRACPPSPRPWPCATPVVRRRSSHRHIHVDHTELLTVASAIMGSDVGLKVDGAVSSQLANVARAASKLERRGYDCCWTAEINHDPFLPLVLAAEHTTHIELGTSIAVAFARNPMTVANIGWDLQAYSDGRFILGLGSQVQAHIEKRFSMPWSQPVRRMREFVLALHEIWACWRD